MTLRLARAVWVAAITAVPVGAHAQADNSNSITGQERVVVASVSRGDASPLWRWLRDDARRRDTQHVGREGLTAAELGLLYGGDFALGAGAEGPMPVPAP